MEAIAFKNGVFKTSNVFIQHFLERKEGKFIPILFNTEMVKAILEGRKTQTRRIVKPQPSIRKGVGKWIKNDKIQEIGDQEVVTDYMLKHCKYQVGDILWVRETFYQVTRVNSQTGKITGSQFTYKADLHEIIKGHDKFKPNIFMPKEACRIFLKIKSVRVERVQDITQEDAKAEGVFPAPHRCDGWENPLNQFKDCFRCVFKNLWQKINKNWNDNPWCWVISFSKIDVDEKM